MSTLGRYYPVFLKEEKLFLQCWNENCFPKPADSSQSGKGRAGPPIAGLGLAGAAAPAHPPISLLRPNELWWTVFSKIFPLFPKEGKKSLWTSPLRGNPLLLSPRNASSCSPCLGTLFTLDAHNASKQGFWTAAGGTGECGFGRQLHRLSH